MKTADYWRRWCFRLWFICMLEFFLICLMAAVAHRS